MQIDRREMLISRSPYESDEERPKVDTHIQEPQYRGGYLGNEKSE